MLFLLLYIAHMSESNHFENTRNFQKIITNQDPAFEKCLDGFLNELKSRSLEEKR